MKTEEAAWAEKDKYFICERKGHKMKKCWYYDVKKLLEQNKKEL